MEPVPESREVLDELTSLGSDELAEALARMGEAARRIAPDCVGLSLGLIEHGVTFTLVASGEEAAALDAVQYIDDGPCTASQQSGKVIDVSVDDLLDEGRWAAYARASAAAGVASSLSLPIEGEDGLIGGVNLYGATPDAFEGRHEQLADALGASARGAITNADLPFSTRLAAARAPEDLEHSRDIDIALGMIAAAHEVDFDQAREALERGAARAGIPPVQAARALRDLYSH